MVDSSSSIVFVVFAVLLSSSWSSCSSSFFLQSSSAEKPKIPVVKPIEAPSSVKKNLPVAKPIAAPKSSQHDIPRVAPPTTSPATLAMSTASAQSSTNGQGSQTTSLLDLSVAEPAQNAAPQLDGRAAQQSAHSGDGLFKSVPQDGASPFDSRPAQQPTHGTEDFFKNIPLDSSASVSLLCAGAGWLSLFLFVSCLVKKAGT